MITNVIPRAMMPTVEAFLRIVVTLFHSENLPPVMIAQNANNTMNTTTMLYFDQSRLETSLKLFLSFKELFIIFSSGNYDAFVA